MRVPTDSEGTTALALAPQMHTKRGMLCSKSANIYSSCITLDCKVYLFIIRRLVTIVH